MKRLLFTILAVAAIGLGFAACERLTFGCDYHLTVTWQERKEQADSLPLQTARVYAFYADPSQWQVTSIEDARAGVITSVSNPARRRSYDLTAEPTGKYGNEFDLRFDSSPAMVLVADENYPMWATGDANVAAGLANLYVKLKFRPLDWKNSSTEPIEKGSWKFYGYANVHIPIDTELTVIPSVWEEGQSTSELLQTAGCYIFYGIQKGKGDVTLWEEARSGRAQKQLDNGDWEAVTSDQQGVWVENAQITAHLNQRYAMVVVFNDVSPSSALRMYAFCYLDLENNPELLEENICFDLRNPSAEQTYDIWTVRIEGLEEEQPEEPAA